HLVLVTKNAEALKVRLKEKECTIQYAPGIDKSESIKTEDREIAAFPIAIKEERIRIVRSDQLF
ncbi:MAG TPA: hypothetical protein PLH57_11005, partial [Oligoflexia bacterium]|nr:hypothetical protein [Oligoflexia bacterium]